MDEAFLPPPLAEAEAKPAADADFETVVTLYRVRVFRFALASVGDRDAAETIAQDCFLRAHRAWKQFRNECSMETWLMRITVNLIRDYGRNRRLQFWRRATRNAAPLDGFGEWLASAERSPEALCSERQQAAAVWEAAAALPFQQKTAFLLRFVEEMDLLEIAEAMGLKEGTVKAHLFRAIHAVRERVGAAK